MSTSRAEPRAEPRLSDPRPKSPPGPNDGASPVERTGRAAHEVPLRWVIAGSLALAALSLLLPSTPTFDPWAWINFGREALSLDLDTQYSSSVKPLPLIFTTIFAVAGDAAPDLWLVFARAGGFLALALAYRLASRLAGRPGGVVAGTVAVLALFSSTTWMRAVGMGNAEGLLVACGLWAVERHLDGQRHHALVLAFAAALIRPEAWPFFGLYAAYVFVREPRRRLLAAVLLALVPAFWLGLEWWGTGDAFGGATRARGSEISIPGSAQHFERPGYEVFLRASDVLIAPFKAGAVVALLFGVLAYATRRRERTTLALVVLGAGYYAVVAAMTLAGYPGIHRFLLPAAALGAIVAGIGFARVLQGASLLATRLGARDSGARAARLALLVAIALVSVPDAIPRVDYLGRETSAMAFEADLHRDLGVAVDRVGGREKVLACGRPYTGAYHVPALAWHLRVHGWWVAYEPRFPGMVFRAPPTAPEPPAPLILSTEPRLRPVARAGEWEVYAGCGPLPVPRPISAGAPPSA